MLSPWVLAVLGVLLIALVAWLLLSGRPNRPAAGRQVGHNFARGPNLAAAAAPVEPTIILIEPAEPAPIETVPITAFLADDRLAEIQGDDLQIIEGIGPKIAGVLRGAGVRTFAQLATLEPSYILAVLHAGGVRLADPRSWPEQARLAAAGDRAGLRALQDRLRAGRKSFD